MKPVHSVIVLLLAVGTSVAAGHALTGRSTQPAASAAGMPTQSSKWNFSKRCLCRYRQSPARHQA